VTEASDDLLGARYRLIAQVGQGGMGRVWRAHDETLDRPVAIKEIVLPEGLPPDERFRMLERVKREARLAARLHHPNIVGVHDIIDRGGAPVIVMEFIDGPSLAAWIRENGPLPWQNVVNMAIAVLDALSHAHAAGIVHRDLKPDNIVISGSRAVLTDFGIARLLDGNTALTAPGTVLGTPSYMAPEQIEGREVTTASDLWSLGATLYAAVEGHPPFGGQTMTEVCMAILTRPLPPPRNAGGLEPVLNALLMKDPAARPSAAATSQYLASLAALNGTPTVIHRDAGAAPALAQPPPAVYRPVQSPAQPPAGNHSPVPPNLAQPPAVGRRPVPDQNQQPKKPRPVEQVRQAQPVQQRAAPGAQRPVATVAAVPVELPSRVSRLSIFMAGVLAMAASFQSWGSTEINDLTPTAWHLDPLFWVPVIVIGLLALAAISTQRPWVEGLCLIAGPLCVTSMVVGARHLSQTYQINPELGVDLGVVAALIITLCGLAGLGGRKRRRPA
jgi:serine/threonine protein kinase